MHRFRESHVSLVTLLMVVSIFFSIPNVLVYNPCCLPSRSLVQAAIDRVGAQTALTGRVRRTVSRLVIGITGVILSLLGAISILAKFP